MYYILVGLVISINLFLIFSYFHKNYDNLSSDALSHEYHNNENQRLKLKRQKLKELREYIHLNPEGEYVPQNRIVPVTKEIRDSSLLVLGGSAIGAGLSYHNIYNTFSENEEVLRTLEERFNHEFENATKNQWMEKLKELNESNAMKENYVNNFAGYKAEILGMETLKEAGYEVEQYESKIHPNDDLLAISPTGEKINISVKSYASIDSLKSAVNKHPESNHYLVNQELITEVNNSENLKQWFEDKNINLMNGGYNHTYLKETGEKAFEAFEGMKGSVSEEVFSGATENLFEGIPLAGSVIFLKKIVSNTKSFTGGYQSTSEYGLNLAGDTSRVATSASLAKLAATAGVSLGPKGAIIGASIGGLIGAIGGGPIIFKSRDSLKWGKIYKTQLEVSQFYDEKLFNSEVKSWLSDHVLKVYETEDILSRCKEELEHYSEELNEDYSKLPSVKAVVLEQNSIDLERYLLHKEELLERLIEKIEDEFLTWYTNWNDKLKNQQYKFVSKRMLGEWILKQTTHNQFPLDSSLNESFKKYLKQVEKNPNYSTKFHFSPTNNLSALSTGTQIEMIEDIIGNSTETIDNSNIFKNKGKTSSL